MTNHNRVIERAPSLNQIRDHEADTSQESAEAIQAEAMLNQREQTADILGVSTDKLHEMGPCSVKSALEAVGVTLVSRYEN